mgnify:CR=1 FL=1
MVASLSGAGEVLEHHVQSDVAVLRVVEGAGHGADDLPAQGLPQVHRRGVGLHHGVELRDAGGVRGRRPAAAHRARAG